MSDDPVRDALRKILTPEEIEAALAMQERVRLRDKSKIESAMRRSEKQKLEVVRNANTRKARARHARLISLRYKTFPVEGMTDKKLSELLRLLRNGDYPAIKQRMDRLKAADWKELREGYFKDFFEDKVKQKTVDNDSVMLGIRPGKKTRLK